MFLLVAQNCARCFSILQSISGLLFPVIRDFRGIFIIEKQMLAIGSNLKKARKSRRLSQENVFHMTGISKSRLSVIEKTGRLTAQQLKLLCACYSVTADAMLGLSDSRAVHPDDKECAGLWDSLPNHYKTTARELLAALCRLRERHKSIR